MPVSQLLLDISPEWKPSLDNFVVGRNQELLSVLRQAIASDSGERIFYLWGEHGCGKSHLLHACVLAALDKQHSGIYTHGSIPPQNIGTGRVVVAVDNVETLDENEEITLFNLFNQIRDNGGMLLVSGMESPQHLKLRDDLRSRLGWGMVYQVHALSDEEKAQALTKHAYERGFLLPTEVSQYLLRHGRRDLPSLMAVLDALDEHSLRLRRAPSVPLLKEVLQQELEIK